jgi:hypothetical protein
MGGKNGGLEVGFGFVGEVGDEVDWWVSDAEKSYVYS